MARYHQNITGRLDYYLKDHLGSNRVAVRDSTGVVVYSAVYEPYGQLMEETEFMYNDCPEKFTEKEWEKYESFRFYYFGARYYDPWLGSFSSIDKAGQFPGGYNYCGNNPVLCVDRDGNLFFVPFLVGAAYGALFSSAAYTASSGLAAIMGDYEWTWENFAKGFGTAVLSGAIGGGIGASFSMIGGELANQLSYKMVSNAVSQASTSAIMGEKVTISNTLGMAAGSLAGSAIIGDFSASSKSGWANMGKEMLHSSASGAMSNFLGRSFAYALNSKNPAPDLGRDLRLGAYGGFGNAVAKNAIMGYPIRAPESGPAAEGLAKGKDLLNITTDPVYRSGGLTSLLVPGFAGFGRDIIVTQNNGKYQDYFWVHETGHFWQQLKLGWANTVGKLAWEQIALGRAAYTNAGALECNADIISALCGCPFPY